MQLLNLKLEDSLTFSTWLYVVCKHYTEQGLEFHIWS